MKKKMGFIALMICSILLLQSIFLHVRAEGASVTAYSMPQNLPGKYVSSDFQIQVNGVSVPAYNGGSNVWGSKVSFGTFAFAGSITVTVTADFSFDTARILPRGSGVSCVKSGNSITFNLSNPQNVTVVFDENFQGKVLHLFAQGPETDIPDAGDTNVIYFQPGYYDYSNQAPLVIPSGKTLYLSGGAVLRGRVLVADASNVTICGRGILLDDYSSSDGYDSVALVLKRSSNVMVKDLIISRDAASWSAFMWKCSDIQGNNVKIINPKYASSDGFDIANSHDVTFQNMFIRSCDDSIAVKGTGNSGYNPQENPANGLPNYNITVTNTQLWSDANNAIGIGAETVAGYYDNIHFTNIDILHNFDDYTYPDILTERSAINICALNATPISNITFEDIRLEKGKRLIGINMKDDFWFGSLQGNWSWNSSISGITYKNITSYSPGSNEIRIYGRDSAHTISNVILDNVKINGQSVTSLNDSHFQVNSFAQDIKICTNGTLMASGNGPFGMNIHIPSAEFSTTQGGNNWYYRTWTAGVGTFDMTWNTDQSGHWRGSHSYDAIWTYGGNLFLHPDKNQTMLEWKAPKAGNINITGLVKKFDTGGGDGVTVSLWKNNTMIWPDNGNWQAIAYNDNTGVLHNVHTAVSAGDTISFRVDERSNNAYDTTQWNPAITYE